MKKLVLIDGSSLVHRAFYALPPMHAPDGVSTNAVYGLAGMVVKLLDEIRPEYVVAAFDKSRVTFRTEKYEAYKAHRQETPAELRPQFPLAHELLEQMGIMVVECAGYEADDIIGTYAAQATAAGVETIIVTGDRDALQLINGNVSVWLTKKGITETLKVDSDNIRELFGVDAGGVIELKALMGDSSDNIPGVAGVGEKTALKLLQEYGTLQGVYDNLEAVKGKLRDKLAEGKASAFLSRELATIHTEVELEQTFDAPRNGADSLKLALFCDRLGFRALKSKILSFAATAAGTLFPEVVPEMASQTECNHCDVGEFLNALKSGGGKALAYRVQGRLPQLCCHELALARENEAVLLLGGEADCLVALKEIGNCGCAVFDLKTLLHAGAAAEGVDDAQLLAYVIDPAHGKLPVRNLAQQYVQGWNYAWPAEPEQQLALDAGALLKLMPALEKVAKDRQMIRLYSEMELPLCVVLAAMEENGIKADLEAAEKLQSEFSGRIGSIEKDIFSLAGMEFNINSPKQLGEVLFEKLGLAAARKNKSGGYSTDVEVLQGLQGHHPVVDLILEYRSLTKLNSTYLEALKKLADPLTGRIHTCFNQTVTATGRLSSSEPNLQNIPVKTDLGRRIRSLFVPGEGYDLLLAADYSQIELRILAHLAGSSSLQAAFRSNADIHRVTAAEVFNTDVAAVTPEMRSRAKAVNFGIVYGQSDYGLAKSIHISRKEAAEYIEKYFERYRDVKEYINTSIETARDKGYAETIFGRKRYLPDINSGNYNTRSFAERTAMNTPVQGAAADIIKLAMLAVFRELRKRKLKSRLLLQVHDELVLEVIEEERFEVELLVQSLMENAVTLTVPLTVAVNCGANWVEAK